AVGHERSLLRDAGRARIAGRVYQRSESPRAGYRGAIAQPQFGATSEIAGGNGAIVCGFAGSACEYAGAFDALGIYAPAFGLRVSAVSGARGQFANAVSSRARARRDGCALWFRK